MLVGYNTNVPYKGKLYHVQTEDNGTKNPVIITLLYFKGSILASKKTDYAHLVASPDYKEAVRGLMKEQHKNMIKELIRGVHTEAEAPEPPAETPPPQVTTPEQETPQKKQMSKSLDDILLDYIIKSGDKGSK